MSETTKKSTGLEDLARSVPGLGPEERARLVERDPGWRTVHAGRGIWIGAAVDTYATFAVVARAAGGDLVVQLGDRDSCLAAVPKRYPAALRRLADENY